MIFRYVPLKTKTLYAMVLPITKSKLQIKHKVTNQRNSDVQRESPGTADVIVSVRGIRYSCG